MNWRNRYESACCSDGHSTYDQIVWMGAEDCRKTWREEGARATVHQDKPNPELGQWNYQVGVVCDSSCVLAKCLI